MNGFEQRRGHSATTFRNFAIRQKTIPQKRLSETLLFGKTIRQKNIRKLGIGNYLFRKRTIGNLHSAKIDNEINYLAKYALEIDIRKISI